jgi:ribosomal protein S18 acetylase RimI-like enzyme
MPTISEAIRVRTARPDEIGQVGAMWGAMYEYQRSQGMLLPLRDDAVEIWQRENAARLDTALAAVLVAEPSEPTGELSGFLAAQVKRLPPFLTTGNPKVGYISAIYVLPAARRHRVGRVLVDAALAWFAHAEVGSIELQVIATNELARAFWHSVGFEPELVQMRRVPAQEPQEPQEL